MITFDHNSDPYLFLIIISVLFHDDDYTYYWNDYIHGY